MATYDPYAQEDEELDLLSRQLQAQMLRAPSGTKDWGRSFMETVERGDAKREYAGIKGKRADIQRRSQEALVNALKGDSVESYAGHPTTQALIPARLERDRADKLRKDFLAQFGGGGGALPGAVAASPQNAPPMVEMGAGVAGVAPSPQGGSRGQLPPLQQLLAMAQAAPSEMERNYYKGMIEQYYPKAKKTDELYPQPGGGYAQDPASADALTQAARIKAEAELGMKRQLEGDALIEVAIPGGGTRRMTRREYDQQRGYTPPQGGQQGQSQPGLPPGQQIPPEVLAANARGTPFRAEMAPGGRPQFQDPTQGGMPPPRMGGGGRLGDTDPRGEAAFMKGMERSNKRLEGMETAADAAGSTLSTVTNLINLTNKGLYAGTGADARVVIDQLVTSLGGTPDTKGQNSEVYAATLQDLLRTRIKALGSGTGISNLDLLVTQKGLPQLSNTVEGRKMMLAAIKKDSEMIMRNTQSAQEYFSQRGTLSGWRPQEHLSPEEELQRLELDYRKSAPKKKSALPYSSEVVAARKAADPWGGEGEFTGALANSIKALNPSNAPGLARGFGAGVGNIVRGYGQTAGLASPEDVTAAKEEQAVMGGQVPGYAQGKEFGEVAGDPANYATAATLPLTTAIAAFQGFNRQTESGGFSDKLFNAGKSAGANVVGHTLGRFIPATALGKTMGAQAGQARRELPNVPLAPAQIDPNTLVSMATSAGQARGVAGSQAKALTAELMKDAGMAGKELTDKVLSDQRLSVGSQIEAIVLNSRAKDTGKFLEPLKKAMKSDPNIQDGLAKLGPDFHWINDAMEGGAVKIDARKLDRMMGQMDDVYSKMPTESANKVRGYVEDSLRRVLGKDANNYFAQRTLYGKAKDLERMYLKGRGANEFAGTIDPSAIDKNTAAGRFVDAFGVVNPKFTGEVPIGTSFRHLLQGATGYPVGNVGGRMSEFGLNADPSVKMMLELLRSGAPIAPREAVLNIGE